MDKKNLTIIILSIILVIAIAVIVSLLPKDTKTVYTISFNTDGGNEVVSQRVEEGKTITKPVAPSKEGYEFLGWYLDGKYFDFETEVEENLTLDAKWKEIAVEEDENDEKVEEDKKDEEENKDDEVTKYTVKFDVDGKILSTKTVEKNKTVKAPTDPKKDGYTFKGWYLDGAEYNFSSKVTKNITLTAKWEKNDVISYIVEDAKNSATNQVTVYVTLNGKKVAGTVEVTSISGKTITLNVPATGNNELVKGTYSSISNPKVK